MWSVGHQDTIQSHSELELEYEEWKWGGARDVWTWTEKQCSPVAESHLNVLDAMSMGHDHLHVSMADRTVECDDSDVTESTSRAETTELPPIAERVSELLNDLESVRRGDLRLADVLQPSHEERAALRGWFSKQRPEGMDAMAIRDLLELEPLWIRSPVRLLSNPEATRSERYTAMLKHLTVRVPVPDAFLARWHTSFRCRLWVTILGQGGNMSECGKQLGWWFHSDLFRWLEAPEVRQVQAWGLGLDEMLRMAEILRLGAPPELAEAMDHRPRTDAWAIDPTDPPTTCQAQIFPIKQNECWPDDFARQISVSRSVWTETVRWFGRWKEAIPPTEFLPILDWATHTLKEHQQAGQRFSWEGRSPEVTRREATEFALRFG